MVKQIPSVGNAKSSAAVQPSVPALSNDGRERVVYWPAVTSAMLQSNFMWNGSYIACRRCNYLTQRRRNTEKDVLGIDKGINDLSFVSFQLMSIIWYSQRHLFFSLIHHHRESYVILPRKIYCHCNMWANLSICIWICKIRWSFFVAVNIVYQL